MAGIALAQTPLALAAAVIVAGSCTGLASPPMAAAVVAAVRKGRRDMTTTVINAGTSAGVALSGPIALALTGQWRLAFGVFAVVALGLAIIATTTLPAARGERHAGGLPPLTPTIGRLICASFLMGASSTALWSFGGQLVIDRLGWGTASNSLLWTRLGAGGILGAWAGTLIDRFGLDRVPWAFLVLLALGILTVGSGIPVAGVPLLGGAVFGTAYVMQTGVYLVWCTTALPDRPATGVMIGFVTIADGQTAGAPLFGVLLEGYGPEPTVAAFAALTLLAALFRSRKAHRPAPQQPV